ncbi:1-deoxy-D-xylulose-5-phosphate reductoisomerase [Sphingobacterium thalpophilum]|uniref:1-deoxy-D-xylulose 5-phosphate reductoisomerase n=1 Tax=Sphingobacterium thalpophilum TaxID=259 RepID=A0A4U9W531_9SPHI|nr:MULTISPECIES: 1-deoxy-D-xylulose-5-phosphate reductoisomerase [Sphingobacterium]MCW8311583.1 1-deoxy-D-xylulose-5-phosphate reductoisomerase [Sphingobacterium sp. InxBP1]VTR53855.1 1-deoxy-D-xylulose 5-phosphate reductoisomerase [Sphingobacterium thalpophilum]
MSKKGIAILGATGSVGTQALDVIRAFPDVFEAVVLTCGSNGDLLIKQALEFKPKSVVVTDPGQYNKVREALQYQDISVLLGEEGLIEAVQYPEISIVLNAIVGSAGLRPTVTAIKGGKDIALANKETLVVAGELIMALVRAYGVNMLPVDSEHSAIFQCLVGESDNPIEKIYVTASGGPFRGKKREELLVVTKAQALKHPNWSMGAKITIDSASLMNKGLEVIEAKWLFDLNIDQVDVVVHPESIVHSLVQFRDGSMKAQMGLPDMKLPIQYALTYPARFENNFQRFNFMDYPALHFEQADMDTFRNLALAYDSLRAGGNKSCILNAANEVVVEAFLKEKIGFLQMSDIIEETLSKVDFIASPTLEDYLETDRLTRLLTKEIIKD